MGIESDGKDTWIENFRETAAGLKISDGVRKAFDEELTKLQGYKDRSQQRMRVW